MRNLFLILGLLSNITQAGLPPVKSTGENYITTQAPSTVVANPVNLSGTNVTGVLPAAKVGPGGSTTQVQYNNAGVLAGDAGLVWDNSGKKCTITKGSIGATTPGDGLLLQNTTAATNSVQQFSPSLRLSGRQFRSNSSLSKSMDFLQYVAPSTNIEAIGSWRLAWSGDSSTPVTLLDLANKAPSTGQPRFTIGAGVQINLSSGNSQPTTNDHLTFDNTGGGEIHTLYKISGTSKYATSVSPDGTRDYYATGSSGHIFNYGSNIFSQAMVAQIYSGGIYNNYGSFNQGAVTAGQANQTPKATLTAYGSYASKGKLITSDYTISNNPSVEAQFYYCDTTNSSYCGGTPSSACSSYSYAACSSHTNVGCSPVLQGACSNANSTDSGTCTGQSGSCTWDTSSCSAYNNDSVSCGSVGFPSGSQCSFTPASCSDYASSEATCSAQGVYGCTADQSDCSVFSDGGGDGSACSTQPTCSYDSGSGSCSGNYYAGSCSGSYSGGPDGACSGSYATGICSGGDYGYCGGTAACLPLGTGSGCAAETGCSVVSGLTITMPSIATNAGTADTGNLIGIQRIAGSGTVTIARAASTSDLFYTGGSSISVSTSNVPYMLHPLTKIADCGALTTQSPCEAASCTWVPEVVCSSYNVDEAGCNNHSGNGCSYDSGTNECSGAGTPSSCYGTPAEFRKWFKWN